MSLLRKDLKVGFLAGAVLLALAVVYALVLTFSGSSPESPQTAQGPAPQVLPEQDGASGPDLSAGEDEPAADYDAPIGPELLARTTQAPAEDWGVYGFKPLMTETPVPGDRGAAAAAKTGDTDPIPHLAPGTLDAGTAMADAMPGLRTHVIAGGETLSAIAQKYYGDANLYTLIQKANPNLDSTRLKVGQKVLIPDRESGAAAPIPQQPQPLPATQPGNDSAAGAPEAEVHVVKPGDTLARIASQRFGREALWEEIYKLNRDQIGADPARLKVGMKLKMPS